MGRGLRVIKVPSSMGGNAPHLVHLIAHLIGHLIENRPFRRSVRLAISAASFTRTIMQHQRGKLAVFAEGI
jgi:hypothetical protein